MGRFYLFLFFAAIIAYSGFEPATKNALFLSLGWWHAWSCYSGYVAMDVVRWITRRVDEIMDI